MAWTASEMMPNLNAPYYTVLVKSLAHFVL